MKKDSIAEEAMPLFELTIATAKGEFTAGYSAWGLAELSFPKAKPGLRQRRAIPQALRQQIADWHRITTKALKTMLTGRKPLELPPLDVVAGTPFRRDVWRAMQRIPWGKTASYGDIAKAVGRPKAVRAVGSACGANMIPVFIPCHRILAAGGRIGGFTSGLEWKRILLDAEGVDLKAAV